MTISTYSPSEVNVVLGGIYSLGGFSSNSIITVTKDEQPFEYQKAIDGSIARLHKRDSTFTLSISLAQTSLSNDILTSIFYLDENTGLGKFPILVKDNNGTSRFFGGNCWIENLPPLSFTDGIETREWSIKCSKGFLHVGGNSDEVNQILETFGGGILEKVTNFTIGG